MTGQEPVAECPECGQPVPATVSAGPVQVQTEHPSRVTAGEVQVVWDEEGPEGVADWIRSMAPAPGFLRVQDAIRDAVDDRGVDLPDVADIAYVATEAVMPLLGSSTPGSTTADVRDVSGLADRLRELGLHAAVALLDDCPAVETARPSGGVGQPDAADPQRFAVGDRVRVKSTGRTGVLREIDSRGRHLIFGDDESWITGVRADNLEPAPEPPRFERGFYRLARDLSVKFAGSYRGVRLVAVSDQEGDAVTVWTPGHGEAEVSAAALAAAGAVRVDNNEEGS